MKAPSGARRKAQVADLGLLLSGCRDSNPGPLDPQSSALTKLRHSPSLVRRPFSTAGFVPGWPIANGLPANGLRAPYSARIAPPNRRAAVADSLAEWLGRSLPHLSRARPAHHARGVEASHPLRRGLDSGQAPTWPACSSTSGWGRESGRSGCRGSQLWTVIPVVTDSRRRYGPDNEERGARCSFPGDFGQLARSGRRHVLPWYRPSLLVRSGLALPVPPLLSTTSMQHKGPCCSGPSTMQR